MHAAEETAVVGHPAKRYRPTSAGARAVDPAAPLRPRRRDPGRGVRRGHWLDRGGQLADVAAEYGASVGRRAAAAGTGDSRLLAALRVLGYEPVVTGDEVVLRNCPFRHVAQARAEIICPMNLAFVAGVLAGTQTRSLTRLRCRRRPSGAAWSSLRTPAAAMTLPQ